MWPAARRRPRPPVEAARPGRWSSCSLRCVGGCIPGNAAYRSMAIVGDDEPGELRQPSAWLDVYRDLVELEAVSQPIFDLVGNAVRAGDVGCSVHRDRELSESPVARVAGSYRIRGHHAVDA